MADEIRNLAEQLERQWRDALCSKDMERLRTLVHPEFVLIGTASGGPFTMSREEWLDAIQRRDPLTIDLKVTDAARFGDVIVGTVKARWRIRYLGNEIEDCVLLTDVWALDGGQWQVVRRHSTPAPPEGEAA